MRGNRMIPALLVALLFIPAIYMGYTRYYEEKPPYTLAGNLEVTVIPQISGGFEVSIGVSPSFRAHFDDFRLSVTAPDGKCRRYTSNSSLKLPFFNGSYRIEVSGTLTWRGVRYSYSAVASLEVTEANGSFRVLLTSLKESYTKK